MNLSILLILLAIPLFANTTNGEAREQFLMGKVALENGNSKEALGYFLSSRNTLGDTTTREAMGVSVYIAMVHFYNQNYLDCYNTGYFAMSVLPPGGFRQKFERMILKAKMEVIAQQRKQEESRLAFEAENRRIEEQQRLKDQQALLAQQKKQRRIDEEKQQEQQQNANAWSEYQEHAAKYPSVDYAFTANPLHNEAAIYFIGGGVPEYTESQMATIRNQIDLTSTGGSYFAIRGSWGEKGIATRFGNTVFHPWMVGIATGWGMSKHSGLVGGLEANVTKVTWTATSESAYDIGLAIGNLRWQYRFPNQWKWILLSGGVQGGIHLVSFSSTWYNDGWNTWDIANSYIPKNSLGVLEYGSDNGIYLDYKLILETGVCF
jgi:hypothetical protein